MVHSEEEWKGGCDTDSGVRTEPGIEAWSLLTSGLFEGGMSLRAVMLCERAAWIELVEVRPENFTEGLEVFRGLGERELRCAINCVPGGRGASGVSGAVSIDFKETSTSNLKPCHRHRPRSRYNSIRLKHVKIFLS